MSRRREVAEGSARSLLMTTLGEFVLPFGQRVWTSTLVRALGLVGIEEGSARQALARTAAEGWLTSDRIGRRVRWSLTDAGRGLLEEGAHRIYSFGSEGASWDGRWLVVLISIPESMRALRHKVRTQLSWAGFGSPLPGVWISPHTSAAAAAKAIFEGLELGDKALSFVAEYGALGSQNDMVSAAWDLADVERHYEDFIEEFSDLEPRSADDVLVAQLRLVHEWRRFPFLDPQLPRLLLPPHWSGTAAKSLFESKHTAWQEPARRRWSQLAADAD
ncbi:PaaX family transcriptional regulator C-terminal domain-containing protein [Mycolicibacterium moriokaense]|uniref:PaaX family transcriptional regulator n=1 Tax=Mycolicibacterium moriokaense TaxID=39691 RepID=UPI001C65C08A|nr:PaaX family transcriptional regulator C-terminal domain-containing protein [Mycolicibacterium moriokaense]